MSINSPYVNSAGFKAALEVLYGTEHIGCSVCSTMSSRNVARIGELLTVQIGREIYGLSLIKYQKNDCSYKRHVCDSFQYLTIAS